ncbi:hypothetical protein [Algoriphagus formosus]|uniref:Uncharacterized protein n=1 Tax=Algoriphagus formosus TaxID=2007308 RepID=A0A4R5UTP5_9BACT|nr:hypothetical protein [Algoriphagus aquimaris]TDK42513.1 hypothetical protein E1898_13770 [Algoriphagus aquimaris]
MKTANTISLTRMGWLLRYSWKLNKGHYLAFILSIFLIISILFGVILFSNAGMLNMLKEPYRTSNIFGYAHGLFLSGYFVICLLWVGQSFLALRNAQNAKSYLMLPASNAEKYIVELSIKMAGLFIIYPIIFWVASNLGLGLFQLFGPLFFTNVTIDYIGILESKEFWLIEDFGEQLFFIKLILLGLFALIPSLIWAGSLIFGKYNFIWMPFSFIVVYLAISATSIALSWIMFPGTITVDEQVKFEILNVDKPEILPETPLIIIMAAIWIWLAVILSYVVAYFKLTEKQV